jgi:hypothetical protein
MSLTTTTTLALLALAAGVAWYLGGREGTGVLAGFLAGASIAGLSLALQRRIATEKPLLGGFLDQVLAWPRPYSPAGCYCDQDSRQHKWGLVFEVLHFALAQREAVVAPVALESGPRSNGF